MAKFNKAHKAALSKAAKARYTKKKRGVKPGTKRGKYKTLKGKSITLDQMDKAMRYTPAPILTLCGQLEDSILLLENRISNAIAKINSLM